MANKTNPTPKRLLLTIGLTTVWVADEEDISFCQCDACGEQFTRPEHGGQGVA